MSEIVFPPDQSGVTGPLVNVVPHFPPSDPPKDGFILAVYTYSLDTYVKPREEDKVSYIFWDVSWGNGRGCWFDINNKLVPEKTIKHWERRVPEAVHYQTVLRLNTEKVAENVAKR